MGVTALTTEAEGLSVSGAHVAMAAHRMGAPFPTLEATDAAEGMPGVMVLMSTTTTGVAAETGTVTTTGAATTGPSTTT